MTDPFNDADFQFTKKKPKSKLSLDFDTPAQTPFSPDSNSTNQPFDEDNVVFTSKKKKTNKPLNFDTDPLSQDSYPPSSSTIPAVPALPAPPISNPRNTTNPPSTSQTTTTLTLSSFDASTMFGGPQPSRSQPNAARLLEASTNSSAQPLQGQLHNTLGKGQPSTSQRSSTTHPQRQSRWAAGKDISTNATSSHSSSDTLSFASNSSANSRPLLAPLDPSDTARFQSDTTQLTSYTKPTDQSQKDFNRQYYNMDENSSAANEDQQDVFQSTSTTHHQGKFVSRSRLKHPRPQPAQPIQQNASGNQVTAHQASKTARYEASGQDINQWFHQQAEKSRGGSVNIDLNQLRDSMATDTVVIYPYYNPPTFLSKYDSSLVLDSNSNQQTQTGQTSNALNMFKQDKVKVCQKEDGHMMKLAKDGNKSILEYRNEKQRLQNTDRYWEAKGTAMGKITGADQVVTAEDKEREDALQKQQSNEIGGYVGDPEWIQRQLAIDMVLFKDEYKQRKQEMLKQLAGGVKSEIKSDTSGSRSSSVKKETDVDNVKDDNIDDEVLRPTMRPQQLESNNPAHSSTKSPAFDESSTDNKDNEAPTSIETDQSISDTQRKALKRLEIRRVRDNLPVFRSRDDFLRSVRENQVIIVIGETGSGKTTQLAQYLWEEGYSTIPTTPEGYTYTPNTRELLEEDDWASKHKSQSTPSAKQPLDEHTKLLLRTGKKIVVTQPRRVAATSVAARVAEEMDVELGTTVGYSIRFEECLSPYTAIKFMTDGILLRETISDPDLNAYSCIIMDEAHERSLNTDILFGLIRDILSRRSDLKLIVTSATMDEKKFVDFFGGAPSMRIPGRTFKVDHVYEASVPADYILAAARKVLQVHLDKVVKTMIPFRNDAGELGQRQHLQPDGDILVFMTGQDDVEATCYYIRKELEKNDIKLPLWVLPITSTLPQDVQQRIFAPSSIRKCIVATNIAETSLTIDGVRYVIDSGLYKLKTYNPQLGMDMLSVTPISQASANQRAGRAGRTSAGVCYRLFRPEEYINELLPQNIAEIHRTNLSNVILNMKAVFSGNIFQFNFLERPSTGSLLSALYHLYVLGAIDQNEKITPTGRLMSQLPLDPPLCRILIEAIRLECLNEVLTLCAMLTIPTIFNRPHDRKDVAEAAHAKYGLGEGDFLTLINIYTMWAFYGYSQRWCDENYFQFKGLSKAREVRTQLLSIISQRPFMMKVVENFTTQDERQKALEIAQIQFNNTRARANNSNNGSGYQPKRTYGEYESNLPGGFNHQQHQQQRQHQQQGENQQSKAPKKSPSLEQLQLEQLEGYQIYQRLLTNAKHILQSQTTPEQWDNIRKCICSGFFINAAKLVNGTVYKNVRTGITCDVHASSSLGMGSEYVVYQDVVVTTKNYMRMVCSIEPEWLAEYGSMVYQMKIKKAHHTQANSESFF